MMDRKFKHGDTYAQNDKNTLENWLRGRITISLAMESIKNNNDWEDDLSKEEFIEIANNLGFRKWNASDEYDTRNC